MVNIMLVLLALPSIQNFIYNKISLNLIIPLFFLSVKFHFLSLCILRIIVSEIHLTDDGMKGMKFDSLVEAKLDYMRHV